MTHVCARCGRSVECGDRDPRLTYHLCHPPRTTRSQVRPAALTADERRHEARMTWARRMLGAELERSLDSKAWLPADEDTLDEGRPA